MTKKESAYDIAFAEPFRLSNCVYVCHIGWTKEEFVNFMNEYHSTSYTEEDVGMDYIKYGFGRTEDGGNENQWWLGRVGKGARKIWVLND